MINPADTYQIGALTRTHGLRGELLFQFTDDIFDRADADHLLVEIDGILTPFYIEEYRFRSNESALILFEGVETAEAARALTGCAVYVERSMSEGQEDAVSLDSLKGFRIFDQEGRDIGVIVAVDDHTQNWLFMVRQADGSEVLIPAHDELIAQLIPSERRITMNLPEGLLNL